MWSNGSEKKTQDKITFFEKRHIIFTETQEENSHWELFCKKGVPRYVFALEFEVFWIVGKEAVLLKAETNGQIRYSVKNMSLCLWCWDVLNF